MPPDPSPRPQSAHRPELDAVPRRRAAPRRRPPDPTADGPLVPGTGLPILRAQRDAGNAAVVGALEGARRESLPIRAARVPVQRNVPPPPPSGIPDNYDEMSDTQKAAVIRDLVARDPGSVYRAWKRLGNPLAVARANPDLFTASMKIDNDIVDLDAFEGLRDVFEQDVLATARGYLTKNKGYIEAERERTGAVRAGDTAGGAVQAKVDILSGKGATADTDEEVQKIQKAAEKMEDIKKRKAICLSTPVGYAVRLRKGAGGEYFETHSKVVFEPGKPPEGWEPGTPTYDEVLDKWSTLIQGEAQLVRKHPSAAFFIGEGGDPSKLRNEQDIRVARAEIANALDDLEGKINKAIPLVGDDIDFNELVPIHGQLMGGTPGASGTIWSRPVEKAVAKETVSDADMWDLLATLGVGTLAAALFIFSELASGGLATYLWAAGGIAVGAGQAAKSWKDYTDLAAANKASINPEEVLISGEQVDDALLAAVLDSVFVAVDAFQGIKGAVRVARGGQAALEGGIAGAKVGAASMLKNLRGAPNQAAALAQAVAEVGLEQARKLSGLGYDELAKIAGEGTDLGKRFAMLAEKGAGAMSDATKALVAQLPDVAKLGAEEGEKVLAAAVSQYGYKGALEKAGGWAALKASPVMKSGAGTAAALEGWRSSIVKELAQFMEEESGRMSKAVRSGTEQAASDLDVQVIGGTASELQAKAEGWLAGRLGTDSKAAKKLLDAEIFVDPTRAHLIDVMRDLGEDVRGQIQGRMASYEQQMIYGARLKEAKKQGKEAVEKLMAEARERGITPFEGFEPLSPALQKQTAAQIDAWMVELKDPANAARRAELVEKISKAQAHVNASHPDAYVGGGVAIWVSGRDTDVAKIAEALNLDPTDLTKVTTAQRISAALSEGKWLDAAVQQLKVPGGSIDDLTKAVRNVGKHGARAAEVLKVPGKTNVGRLEYLMDVLLSYKAVEPAQLKELVTSGDLALMRGEITRILDGLASETTAAVSALQKDAGALGVSISEMADFQHWLKWSGRYRMLTGAAAEGTAAQVRLLETALEGAQQQSVQPPRESRDYPLPPNQSVMPPG